LLDMRYSALVVSLCVSMAAQGQSYCTGVALDFDARCACIKYPNSDSCALVKAGLYEPHDFTKSPFAAGWKPDQTAPKTVAPAAAPSAKQVARPRQARVVPLAHKDYLRFLQPNASFAAGFDLSKASESPGLVEALLGQSGANENLAAAIKEMDHFWLSVAGPNDVLVLMTGRFEKGAAAGLFYSQGIYPVFLGGPGAMMIGPEPSLQGALARLVQPPAKAGWVAQRARELSKDHETWLVTEPKSVAASPEITQLQSLVKHDAALPPIKRFAIGIRTTGEAAIDGEAVADSEAGAFKISAWIDQMKAAIREKTGVGVLDPLSVSIDGATLRFTAKDDHLVAGDAGQKAMNSDFGAELYGVVMSGFPGTASRIVAEDKLLSVKSGMKREELLALLGPPLAITAIQGLETPRETWAYQSTFGKQYSVRLAGGVVTGPAR
jgi:hypothetical protein